MGNQRIGRYEVIRKLPGEPPSHLAHAPGAGPSLLRQLGPVSPEQGDRAVREVTLVATLGHPAIAKAEAFIDNDHVVLATPERGGVSLADLMDRLEQRGDDLSVAAVMHVASAIAGALATSHAATLDDDPVGRICHGFLSPTWVWLDWSGEVSVDGLGLASVASVRGLRVAPAYDAPEQRGGGKATPRGDVYSLAAIVWALLAAAPATDAPSLEDLGERLSTSLRPLLARALEPSLGKRTITSEDLASSLATMVSDEGKQALGAALLALRKGTNALGTLRRPGLPPVAPGGVPGLPKPPSPAPFKSTLPAMASPLPRPAGGPALPPRPAAPGTAPRPVGASPLSPAAVAAPLGSRLPPPRAKLGSTGDAAAPPTPAPPPAVAAAVPAPAVEPPAPPPPAAPSSEDSLPPPPPADDLELASPPPLTPPSDPSPLGDIDVPPPPPSARPRLPSITSGGVRPSKAAYAIEDELSWGVGETAHIAAAVDAALLDDLVGLPGAGSQGRSEPGSTKPSSPSDTLPPSVDSLASPDLAPPPSSRRGFGLEGGLVDLPPSSTGAPVPPPPPPGPPSSRAAASFEAAPASTASPAASASPATKPLSLGKALGVGLGAALLVFAGGAFWLTRSKQLPPPSPGDLEAPTAAATASASAVGSASQEASAAGSAEAAPSTTASAEAAPSATASAEASATPSAEASAAPSAAPAAPAVDTSALAPNQAILLVHFTGNPAADVYFFARVLGKVEQPITVPCDKPLFLRVGTQAKPTDPPLWLSEGRPYNVTCQKLNEFTIAGKP